MNTAHKTVCPCCGMPISTASLPAPAGGYRVRIQYLTVDPGAEMRAKAMRRLNRRLRGETMMLPDDQPTC